MRAHKILPHELRAVCICSIQYEYAHGHHIPHVHFIDFRELEFQVE